MEENLNNIGKRMPYKVPEGFFEEMHGRLMDKTVNAQSSTISLHSSHRRFWMSAAAVVLLIAGVSFYALHRMEQADVLYKLRKAGYAAEFAIGFDEAIKIIDEYLGDKK